MIPSALLLASLAASSLATPLQARQQSNTTTTNSTSSRPTAAPATYDGSCYYPQPDPSFNLTSYLGRWYQVAGTPAPFTAACSCITADYGLNDNGTVSVLNNCQVANRTISISGTGTPIPSNLGYGQSGILSVQFPGQPGPECPGPNYIVQEFAQVYDDVGFAIVQASNFSTLFLLSREQNPGKKAIDQWLERAGRLGSDLGPVELVDQTGCVTA